jgi:glutaminase
MGATLANNGVNPLTGEEVMKPFAMVSTHFGLHMLNRSADVRTSIMADYDIGAVRSPRSRLPRDQKILADHHKDVRIIELAGAHSSASMDYVCRRLGKPCRLS